MKASVVGARSDTLLKDVSQSPDGLPQYAAESAAFHEAFVAELRSVVESLPLELHMRVLDVGCGDGFYTELLAERLGSLGRSQSNARSETGEVVAVDNNPNFLRVAEERIRRRRSDSSAAPLAPVRFLQADLNQLAAESPIYDLAWCAQSLFSFPEPVSSLKKIGAALKPGGLVVVLENDTLHQLLLPWPTEQELVVRSAEFAALAAESKRPGKFYVGRRLPAVLAKAGFEPLGFTTQALDRAAPLDEPLARFLRSYLKKLRERIEPHIDPADAAEFAAAIRPEGRNYILNQPHFACTWINVIAVGRKK